MMKEGVYSFVDSFVPLSIDRSHRPMTEKISGLSVRQRITAALLGGALGVTACVAEKNVNIPVSLTPIIAPPAESTPGVLNTSETLDNQIFGGYLIGESGVGPISELRRVASPDPTFVTNIEESFMQAVPDATEENTEVFVYDMVGEKGTAPFVIVGETEKEKAMRAYVAFWVDENGVQRPPIDGNAYVYYPLGEYTQPDGKKLIGATSLSGDEMYLPALFTIEGERVFFIPPYTDSPDVEVAPAEPTIFTQEISYKVANATVVPQNPIEAVGVTATPAAKPIETPTPTKESVPTREAIPGIDSFIKTGSAKLKFVSVRMGDEYYDSFNDLTRKIHKGVGQTFLIIEGEYTGNMGTLFNEGGEFYGNTSFFLEGGSDPTIYGYLPGNNPTKNTFYVLFVIQSDDPGPFIVHDEIHNWTVDLSKIPEPEVNNPSESRIVE
jgi:hypothetical protein